MALCYSDSQVELREIVFRDKPQAMLDASSKGTVPTLVLPDGQVLDESREIIEWALAQHDPDNWITAATKAAIEQLIDINDSEFKPYLDRYKYFDRYPEQSQLTYRQAAEQFLQQLENRLTTQPFLAGDSITLADIAVFPFIRQFAFVDKNWFDQAPYPELQQWLAYWLEHRLFLSSMNRYTVWKPNDAPVFFPRVMSQRSG